MPTGNDFNVPYGSQVVTIGGTAVILEAASLNYPSIALERFDQVGQPSGQVIIDSFATGSATLQLATTSSLIPTIGATFTMADNGAGATVGVMISDVVYTESNRDIKKCTINIRKRYAS